MDDQQQVRVRIEAEAKLCLQEKVRGGTLELAWSYMLDFENSANPFEERRTTIEQWKQFAAVDVIECASILESAILMQHAGLKAKDALHVACAIEASCEYFVTTDDALLKRGEMIQGILVIDPPALVRELNL